jgi:hypothetical protein
VELNNVTSTTIQFPPGARGLIAGNIYAWKVSAFMRGALLGESEVWRFKYAPSALTVEAPPPVKPAKKKNLTINVLEELLQSCSDDNGVQISTPQLKK